MSRFSQRSTQPELMDTEEVSFEEFDTCLRHLSYINHCTLAYRPTLHWLKHQLRSLTPHQHVTIMDIGSGGGDMLRRIRRCMIGRPIAATLIGIDINPWSKQSAMQVTLPEAAIEYETCDIFAMNPERRVDFIISSLFTHHLNPNQLVRFIQWSDTHATRGWFINDLHRHRVPWAIIGITVRVLRLHRFILHDAPVSVARSFTARDWRHILHEAGIAPERVSIRWYFPFRYGVSCRK